MVCCANFTTSLLCSVGPVSKALTVQLMPKVKVTRQKFLKVKNNLSDDTPKYEDKAIKAACLACARHFGVYGDKRPFEQLEKELPVGIWRNRLHDFEKFVRTFPRARIKPNFQLIREKLEKISARTGYQIGDEKLFMYYFAYGSNMSTKRLQSRISSATPAGRGKLSGYALRFHKVSIDKSGKCDVVKSDSASFVEGVLFLIDTNQKYDLNSIVKGYLPKTMNVELESGGVVEALVYCAEKTNSNLNPYSWYLQHVVVGAQEAGLSQEYTRLLESTKSTKDPDSNREARELAIYS